jgi:hypothetical protein
MGEWVNGKKSKFLTAFTAETQRRREQRRKLYFIIRSIVKRKTKCEGAVNSEQ